MLVVLTIIGAKAWILAERNMLRNELIISIHVESLVSAAERGKQGFERSGAVLLWHVDGASLGHSWHERGQRLEDLAFSRLRRILLY